MIRHSSNSHYFCTRGCGYWETEGALLTLAMVLQSKVHNNSWSLDPGTKVQSVKACHDINEQ